MRLGSPGESPSNTTAELKRLRAKGGICVPEEFFLFFQPMVAGWYLKEGEPRWKFMVPNLKALGYKVAVTHGGFVFGWRV
jgi:hypothetical protein